MPMPNGTSDFPNSLEQRQNLLSRWTDEGDRRPDRPQDGQPSADIQSDIPELTNAELVQLRVRVIALENLVITLLAEASQRQLETARDMAGYIAPRTGFTQHPLTIQAAVHMIDLVNRADRFRP
jgi:hypothetical protein